MSAANAKRMRAATPTTASAACQRRSFIAGATADVTRCLRGASAPTARLAAPARSPTPTRSTSRARRGERREHAQHDRPARRRRGRSAIVRRRRGARRRAWLPSPDAQHSFDAARQRVRRHAAPAGDAHQRPAGRGAAPAVIVRPDDEREVETVGDAHDARALAALCDNPRGDPSTISMRAHAGAACEVVTGILSRLPESSR